MSSRHPHIATCVDLIIMQSILKEDFVTKGRDVTPVGRNYEKCLVSQFFSTLDIIRAGKSD